MHNNLTASREVENVKAFQRQCDNLTDCVCCRGSLFVFFFKSDDIAGIIDEAKRKAASANDTSADTMDKLNVIKDEVDKIKVTPGSSNLSDVLDDVGEKGQIFCTH